MRAVSELVSRATPIQTAIIPLIWKSDGSARPDRHRQNGCLRLPIFEHSSPRGNISRRCDVPRPNWPAGLKAFSEYGQFWRCGASAVTAGQPYARRSRLQQRCWCAAPRPMPRPAERNPRPEPGHEPWCSTKQMNAPMGFIDDIETILSGNPTAPDRPVLCHLPTHPRLADAICTTAVPSHPARTGHVAASSSALHVNGRINWPPSHASSRWKDSPAP